MKVKSLPAFSCPTSLMIAIEVGLMVWNLQKTANNVSQMNISACIMTSKGGQNMTFEQRLEVMKKYVALAEDRGSFIAANQLTYVEDFGSACHIHKDSDMPVDFRANKITIEGIS